MLREPKEKNPGSLAECTENEQNTGAMSSRTNAQIEIFTTKVKELGFK